MTTKAAFNADEWSTVVEGPLLAAMRVITAGRGGTIRESLAVGRIYAEARRAEGSSELLDELAAAPPGVDPQRLGGAGNVAAASEERLREALRLLSEKAPDEVEAYRAFVLDVARAAAEAHKEGGFIGIGGKQVSDEEQAALDELGAIVGGGEAPGGGEAAGA